MMWKGALTAVLLMIVGTMGLAQEKQRQGEEYIYEEFGLTEREIQQGLAAMPPGDRAFWELFWKARKVWKRGERKGNLINYCHRDLRPEEKELIEKLIAFAKKHENDYVEGNYRCYREMAIEELADHPHVCMIDGLKELAWSPPLKDERPWRYQDYMRREHIINTRAVEALHRIADERVIPILIELLEHPALDVRFHADECLGKLLGFGFSAKSWRTLRKARKEGKLTEEEFRKLLEKEMENMENWREVKALYAEWWERNKGKAKIHWGAAWRSH